MHTSCMGLCMRIFACLCAQKRILVTYVDHWEGKLWEFVALVGRATARGMRVLAQHLLGPSHKTYYFSTIIILRWLSILIWCSGRQKSCTGLEKKSCHESKHLFKLKSKMKRNQSSESSLKCSAKILGTVPVYPLYEWNYK